MKRLMAGALACAASLAITAGAQAAPQTYYFDCTGTAPVQTVDVDTYSWSPTAPTASYQEGAGCGWVDPLLSGASQPNPLYDSGFGGLYKGEIRKIDLTLFAADATPIDGKTVNVAVQVDGATVATFKQLTATDAGGPDAAVGKYTFTLDGLDIPATKRDKSIVLAVQTYNDAGLWLQGAKEVPSSAKLYAFDDLTCEEQQQIDDTVVCPG